MQLERITVALRPRAPWEAADLGVALVRQHAARIWSAWVLITLPCLVLLSLLCWSLDVPALAALLLWWLKPLFDRIPMFVLSRAVFGATPSLRETLRAQWSWGWRGALRWMHWRRLHPGRGLLLAVDLLEGVSGAQRAERCRVLARATGSPSLLLTVIGWHVEQMLHISIIVLALLLLPMPIQFLPDSAQAVWETLFEQPPVWAKFLMVFVYWFAMSIMEPFYVGAGFGLYLNRRTELEAWDIELSFRRLAARLAAPAAALLLGIGLLFGNTASEAAPAAKVELEREAETAADNKTTPLATVFSRQYRDDGEPFEAATTETFKDPDLSGKQSVQTWRPRKTDVDVGSPTPTWLLSLARAISFLAENALWVLIGILLLLLIRYRAHWLPWISDRLVVERTPDAIAEHELTTVERLPDDLVAAVRALWQSGKTRAALALFYRAAVARLTDSLGVPLPPGATESECLRQSRRLNDRPYAELFARIVRSWQAIAYAQRTPSEQDLDRLLADWQRPAEGAP